MSHDGNKTLNEFVAYNKTPIFGGTFLKKVKIGHHNPKLRFCLQCLSVTGYTLDWPYLW